MTSFYVSRIFVDVMLGECLNYAANQEDTYLKIVNNPPYIDWGPTANQSGEVIKLWYTNMYSNKLTKWLTNILLGEEWSILNVEIWQKNNE